MGYAGARSTFEEAKGSSEDLGVRKLAEGMIQLSRAIEDHLRSVERELRTISNRVNSLR
jgi:hypothetical protein